MAKGVFYFTPEVVKENNMNPDNNGEVRGTLYRYPIFTDVKPGEIVTDGWGKKHPCPNKEGMYTLYQYVQDGTLMGFTWERSS